MTADKKIEQLCVEPVGVLDDVMHLEPWLDVEIIANVTALQIEIEQANSLAAGLLVERHLHNGFNCKRGVADPTAAWHEGDNLRPNRLIAAGLARRPAGTRNNIQNFLWNALHRYPVGASGADQSLVIAGRNFLADENREDAEMYPLCKFDDAIERLGTQDRKDDVVLL